MTLNEAFPTATGNLAYAARLGLWGPSAPFCGFKEFKNSMEKRGLGALEMLAMELKSKGSYVSRGLGWKGAEFETCEVSWASCARVCCLRMNPLFILFLSLIHI